MQNNTMPSRFLKLETRAAIDGSDAEL